LPKQIVAGFGFTVIIGLGLTVTITFAVSEQPLLLFKITVYVPVEKVDVFFITGFCIELVKLSGPFHLYVALLINDANSSSVSPSHTGELLVGVTVMVLIVTTTEPYDGQLVVFVAVR
jgi:hypothetical protein